MIKKIILGAITATLLTTNLSAMDISSSEGQSQKEDMDRSVGIKESNESRTSDSDRTSSTDAKELSNSKNTTVTRASQTDIFEKLEELEIYEKEMFKKRKTKELGFFGRCSVISNPKMPKNFGITAEEDDSGNTDTTLQSYIESSAKSNLPITKVVSGKEEKDIKEYMNCLLKYGSIGAQSLISGKFTLEITDPEILSMNKSAERNLRNTEMTCRFSKSSEMIQCNSLKITLDYEPILQDKQIAYFSKDSFLGVSGTKQYSTNENSSNREEIAKTLETAYNFSESNEKLKNKKIADSQDVSNKTEISAKAFFSKLFK